MTIISCQIEVMRRYRSYRYARIRDAINEDAD